MKSAQKYYVWFENNMFVHGTKEQYNSLPELPIMKFQFEDEEKARQMAISLNSSNIREKMSE